MFNQPNFKPFKFNFSFSFNKNFSNKNLNLFLLAPASTVNPEKEAHTYSFSLSSRDPDIRGKQQHRYSTTGVCEFVPFRHASGKRRAATNSAVPESCNVRMRLA